ncbi:MAG: substrate-binding domain-containing protein [Spirochaetales bacterium]|nr:substrate-binding domain-containing protein [Spirochaetales bacterium]
MKNQLTELNKDSYRGYRIGVLGIDLFFENPINVFRAAKEFLHRQGHRLVYFSGEAYNSPYQSDNQSNILYDLAGPEILDGLVLVSNLLITFTPEEAFRKRCRAFKDLPLVSMGVEVKGIPSVVLDNSSVMMDLVSHMVNVHQFTRFAYIRGWTHHIDAIERFSAFRDSLSKHQLDFDETLVVQGNFELESGEQAVGILMDERGKLPGRDFQVIICDNDFMAAGAILEFQNRGIDVPGQLAVTGFDNLKFSECLSPSLSTVSYPFKEMTERALENLLLAIEGKKNPPITMVKPEYVPRGSCGCPFIDKKEPLLAELQVSLADNEEGLSLKHRSKINFQIIRSVDPVLDLWRDALIGLREDEKWHLAAKKMPLSSLQIRGDQWTSSLLARLAYNTFNSANYQSILFNMGSAVTSTIELDKLMEILKVLLPQAQISKFCVCLYIEPEKYPQSLPPLSRVILAFDKDSYINLPIGGFEFKTLELLPSHVAKEFPDVHWVVYALFFGEQQLGYLLLTNDSHHEHLFRNLRNQISSAIMGARLLDETRRANELLKEANQQKTRFFINVAHETKTPLTLIKNYLSLYMDKSPPDENLRVIGENIDLLLANMLNFLDVEKLQKDEVLYEHDSIIDLCDYTQKKCALFSELAKKRDITIVTSFKNTVYIQIDPWALDRILNNLLDNAVKYIQKGGRVDVKISSTKEKASLVICDNGPGLTTENAKHIFEPYFLMSKQKTSKQGMGVGLSIVKKILDGLGAEISFSQNKPKGACFKISFVLASAENLTPEITSNDFISAPADYSQPQLKEVEIDEDKPTILVVDDNLQLLRFMQVSLEQDYNIIPAKSVSEALFKLKTEARPDLIIADIMMDQEDGYTLLSEVLSMKDIQDVPFIFLTALSGDKARIKGLRLGALDYIEKPFAISEIKAKIDSHLLFMDRQKNRNMDMVKSRIQDVFNDLNKSSGNPVKLDIDGICRKYAMMGRKPAILKLLLQGLLHKQIALELNISLRTVEYHVASIYKKMSVNTKYELISKLQEEASL